MATGKYSSIIVTLIMQYSSLGPRCEIDSTKPLPDLMLTLH